MRFKEFYRLINESVLKDDAALIGVLSNACTRISEVRQFTTDEVNESHLTGEYFEPPVDRESALKYDVSDLATDINTDTDIQHAIERTIVLIMDLVFLHGEEDSLSEYEVSHKLREGFKPFMGQNLKGWWVLGGGFFGIILNQTLTHIGKKLRNLPNTEDVTGLEDIL